MSKHVPMLPPLVGVAFDMYDPLAAAARDCHSLLPLMKLRQLAAEQVEWLLAFLDATDGDPESETLDEPTIADMRRAAELYPAEQTEDDEEHDPSGIADIDGLIEQLSWV